MLFEQIGLDAYLNFIHKIVYLIYNTIHAALQKINKQKLSKFPTKQLYSLLVIWTWIKFTYRLGCETDFGFMSWLYNMSDIVPNFHLYICLSLYIIEYCWLKTKFQKINKIKNKNKSINTIWMNIFFFIVWYKTSIYIFLFFLYCLNHIFHLICTMHTYIFIWRGRNVNKITNKWLRRK